MRGVPDPQTGHADTGHPREEIASRHARHLSGFVPETVVAVRKHTSLTPAVGIVLGSGLGGVADRVDTESTDDSGPAGADLETNKLPHWPHSTVHGHAGRLVLGYWRRVPVVVLRGRAHRYEGYELDRVTFGVRVMHALGARTLFLTNAVGSMRKSLPPGSLMLAVDHLNWQGTRGLLAPDSLPRDDLGRGERPTPVYTPSLRKLLLDVARDEKIPLAQGILMGGLGPTYESAAEIRSARRIGADAACMSTVTEALVGASLGMAVAAVSSVTNLATGLAKNKLTHEEVTEVADAVAVKLERLLGGALERRGGERPGEPG